MSFRNRPTKSTRATLPVLLGVLATLAGCQTTVTRSGVTDAGRGAPFCAVAEPILYSRNDTPETQRQVREHNAVGMGLGCAAFIAVQRGEGAR